MDVETEAEIEGDYLGEDVVLAAFYMEDGGFSKTRFYPANITTPDSKETDNQYQVESLVGDFDVAKKDKHWTRNVIVDSHPAEADELEVGMIVLFTRAEKNLEKAKWNRGVVSSLDDIFKDQVQIDYVWHLDKEDESDRQYTVPLRNIRIIESE